MREGQRIVITAAWSSFRGRKGTIASVRTHDAFVLLDGDHKPMAFEPSAFSVLTGEASEPRLTGAE